MLNTTAVILLMAQYAMYMISVSWISRHERQWRSTRTSLPGVRVETVVFFSLGHILRIPLAVYNAFIRQTVTYGYEL